MVSRTQIRPSLKSILNEESQLEVLLSPGLGLKCVQKRALYVDMNCNLNTWSKAAEVQCF